MTIATRLTSLETGRAPRRSEKPSKTMC
jgi:hypothetical protein